MDIKKLMQQAQEMQEQMQKAQLELSELKVSGESGGGMVKIEMNGRHDVTKVKINPSLLEDNDDQSMLEDLIAAAINDAVRKVEKASKEKIGQLTSGLNIPNDLMGDQDKG